MTSTRETSYICTPYFCRRNIVSFYPLGGFCECPLVIPATCYDFFAVVMGSVIDGYTLFDDREITGDEWAEFLFISSEYLSRESYSELLELADERLSDWLRINGEFFWQSIDSYRIILSRLLAWSEQNVLYGVMIKGI